MKFQRPVIIFSLILLMLYPLGGLRAKVSQVQKFGAQNFKLHDLTGNEIRLSDFRGKVVLLNFWATWCAPCLREMPLLEKLHQNYKNQDVQIIGIAVVSRTEDIPKTIEATGVTYPILSGNMQVIADYGYFTSIPQSFIISRDGTIIKEMEGSFDYTDFEKEIRAALTK